VKKFSPDFPSICEEFSHFPSISLIYLKYILEKNFLSPQSKIKYQKEWNCEKDTRKIIFTKKISGAKNIFGSKKIWISKILTLDLFLKKPKKSNLSGIKKWKN
jgi:hypothetical protein